MTGGTHTQAICSITYPIVIVTNFVDNHPHLGLGPLTHHPNLILFAAREGYTTGGFFLCCSSCSQHTPVHRFASWATSHGLPTFWIPVGLVLTSYVLPFVSV